MAILSKQVSIGNKDFLLKADEFSNDTAVEFDGVEYKSLAKLVHSASELSQSENLKVFIAIANFLFRGNEFDVIDDIADYQRRYPAISRATREYGKYDISVMHEPRIENGKVIFFAEHSATHVPYRVTCTFPFKDNDAYFHYALLKEVY